MKKSILLSALLGASILVSAHGVAAQARRAQAQEAQEAAPGVVNINTASAEELQRLPGVGPAKAAAILAMRTRRHQFSRVEDLLQVPGIGRATLRRLRPMLTLSGPTTLPAGGAARPAAPSASTQ